jgi:signal transduction histidine kinase
VNTTHDIEPQAGLWPGWFRGSHADAVLALVVGAIAIAGTIGASHRQPDRASLDAWGIVLIAAPAVALVLRRRFPAGVLLFVKAATLTYWLLDYPGGPIFLPLIIAFVTAVMRGRRLIAWSVLGIGYFSFTWLPTLVADEPAPSLGAIFGLAAWLLLLGTLAEVARVRRGRAAEAALMREEENRRRASEERLRIARELHDVLAHNISLINVQAGVALHLIDEQPEQARTALAAIKEASRDVLREVRSTLGVLRQVDEKPPRFPSPSLRRLDDLLANAASAGLQVRKHVTGEPRQLPAAVDAAAFRIVQEALTNVTRHAGAATATITIDYGPRVLSVVIEDDGNAVKDMYAKWAQGVPPARGTQAGGHGILGMRERATALGGDLEAGPRPAGGFRVRARLPLDGEG